MQNQKRTCLTHSLTYYTLRICSIVIIALLYFCGFLITLAIKGFRNKMLRSLILSTFRLKVLRPSVGYRNTSKYLSD